MRTKQLMQMQDMWRRGASIKEIACAIGITVKYVGTYMNRNRELFPYRHHNADVWRVRLDECEGMSKRQVALKYGVSSATVRYWTKKLGETEGGCVGS